MALEPYLPIVWDTNGYYRALGIPPEATRREIREAYQALNGQADARLTYIVSQLLDEDVRARYDATPLGSIFVDEEIEARMQQAWLASVSHYLAEQGTSLADLLGADDHSPSVSDLLDSLPETGHDAPCRSRAAWEWSWYDWACTRTPHRLRLAQWQRLLVSALGRRGVVMRIAVGVSGVIREPWVVTFVGFRMVAFLSEETTPTEALADAVASRVAEIKESRTE